MLPCCATTQCKKCAEHKIDANPTKCWADFCQRKIDGFDSVAPANQIQAILKDFIEKWKKENKVIEYCLICELKGHSTVRCPSIVCIKCGQPGHGELI